MKQLRVLTGRHAGVQLSLSASEYRISADEQADIQILDWQAEPLLIELKEDNVIAFALESRHLAQPSAGAMEVFEDFVPRRFGDVVLCTGDHDAAWPTDMELLERLMRPVAAVVEAVKALPKPRRAARLVSACAAASVAVIGIFAVVVSRNVEAAKARVAPEPLLGQVWRAVTTGGFSGVTARTVGDRVVVEGLLADGSAVVALGQALARFPADRIDRRYASAADVAQSISDALPMPGLEVTYRGHGVFAVGGRVTELDRLRDAAKRVGTDLAPLVQGIEVVATEAPAPDRVPVGAMLATDGLQYVQTRDGVKHLTLVQEPIAELTDPPAGTLR
jgi:type III secretion protein D